MPRWIPEQKWLDEDVFVIGGGDSLRKYNFDWNLLKPELTIGCNAAYVLGKSVCKICFFGDVSFFNKFKKQLEQSNIPVFTNCTQLLNTKLQWLWTFPRKPKGLLTDALGWNKNTGASAINLALLLGAKRIFLLGFDMNESQDRRTHWHNEYKIKISRKLFESYLRAFDDVLIDWKKKFSDREIINVTKCSGIKVFPIIDFDEFWNLRKLERKEL